MGTDAHRRAPWRSRGGGAAVDGVATTLSRTRWYDAAAASRTCAGGGGAGGGGGGGGGGGAPATRSAAEGHPRGAGRTKGKTHLLVGERKVEQSRAKYTGETEGYSSATRRTNQTVEKCVATTAWKRPACARLGLSRESVECSSTTELCVSSRPCRKSWGKCEP